MVLSGYKGYAKVSTNTTLISGTSTEIVGYVDLADLPASWWSNVASDGSDIAVTTDDSDTKIARELVGFDSAGNTGQLFFGPITVTSASSSSWRIYAGNASASESNSTSVWADCVRVYHCEEDPSGSAPQLYNSATGTYDGTANGTMTSGDLVTAKVGSGIDFDGSNDYFDGITDTAKTQLTAMAWVRRNSTATWDGIYGQAGGFGFHLQIFPSGGATDSKVSHYLYGPASSAVSTTSIPADSNFYHVAGAYASGSTHRLYVNGNQEYSASDSGTVTAANNVRLGYAWTDRPFDGTIDEFRYYTVSLTADQISTEYEQQNSPSTFWTASWVNVLEEAGWTHKATVTTNTALITGTSTQIVGYLDLSNMDATFFSNAKADGSDIIIVPSGDTTDANKLPRELVGFSTATSVGDLFFGPITVTSAASSSWDVWVGNASGAETNSTAVWADYGAVWHFEEDPSGSAPQLLDSTANNNDGTTFGTMTTGDEVTGKIGSGWDFDGTDDYVNSAYAPILDSFTIQYWINYTQTTRGDPIGVLKEDGTNDIFIILYTNVVAGKAGFQVGDGDGTVISTSGTTTINDGSWHHVALVYDDAGSTIKMYVDANLDVNETRSYNAIDLTSNPFGIGMPIIRGGTTTSRLNGVLDEVRISPNALTADQIATEYQQQNAPQTFWTYGATTGGGGGGGLDEVDSFEDANFTSNPTWSNDSTGSNGWNVDTGTSYDGSYALQRSGVGNGDESILTHTRPSADPTPIDGDQWYAWFYTNSTATNEQTEKYRLSDGTDYVEVQLNDARDTVTITDGTSSDTVSVTVGSNVWFKLAINFNASSNVTGAVYDNTDTIIGETATGITHSLANVSSVQVRVLNGANAFNTGTYADQVKYGQAGVAPSATDNALFHGGGA